MPARQVENIANHGGLRLNIKFCIGTEKEEEEKNKTTTKLSAKKWTKEQGKINSNDYWAALDSYMIS